MRIGLSFSMCVRDIYDGKVPEADVAYIVANTKCHTEADWEYVVQSLATRRDAVKNATISGIIQRLRAAHKIVQPRLYDPNYSNSLVGSSVRWAQEDGVTPA